MKINLKISKILDEYLPADGIGTEREELRINLHREIMNLSIDIPRPEFTKDDLIDFLEYLCKQNDRHNEIESDEFVDEWINNK